MDHGQRQNSFRTQALPQRVSFAILPADPG
jgi:hypothetical protein